MASYLYYFIPFILLHIILFLKEVLVFYSSQIIFHVLYTYIYVHICICPTALFNFYHDRFAVIPQFFVGLFLNIFISYCYC